MNRPIVGRKLFESLVKAGIADKMTKRVTIDIPANDVVTVYIERYGDSRVLDILPAIVEDPSLTIDRVDRPQENEDFDEDEEDEEDAYLFLGPRTRMIPTLLEEDKL